MDEFRYEKGVLHAERTDLEALAREHGTPLYVYSRATLLDHYRKVRDAFAPLGGWVAYSVKACSNLSILRLLAAEGAGFDVVSGGELERVREAGGDLGRTVFAGVGKTDAELAAALDRGVHHLNVESREELERLDRIARAKGVLAPAALRVNPDVDPRTHRYITTGKRENKFGVDLETASAVFADRAQFKNVALRGVHMHIGSQLTEVAPYAQAVEKVVAFADGRRKAGADLHWLNLGGGFGIWYEDRAARPVADFARAAAPFLEGKKYEVVVEPGRFICGNAGVLLARVVDVKRSGGKRFIIVDAGMSDLIRPSLYKSFHAIWPVRSDVDPRAPGAVKPETLETADVVGPICESGDFLALDRGLPAVGRGDLLCVFSAGAYGFSMSSNYNTRPRPAEVLVSGAEARVVRRRETLDDLLGPER
ncbi:MAG TPA: diaminopimelate decarboxylase [Planctomycetota bacterium]|nr:diaminopimelate decarboxylase [Planctomycetota bacterium]